MSLRLLDLQFFLTSGLYQDPPFISFKKTNFFTKPSFYFLSFLLLFTPNIHSKIAYCSYILVLYFMATSFCSFYPCIIIQSFSEIPTLPVYSDHSRLLNFRSFPTPLFIRTPVYLALESIYMFNA